MKKEFVLMKSRLYLQQFLRALGLPTIALVAFTSAFAAPANIFSTQFEPVEGYTTASNLVGQAEWLWRQWHRDQLHRWPGATGVHRVLGAGRWR
jgi:hypothetical protein